MAEKIVARQGEDPSNGLGSVVDEIVKLTAPTSGLLMNSGHRRRRQERDVNRADEKSTAPVIVLQKEEGGAAALNPRWA
ncbi:hypothetical protein M0R45_025516 [Rubus argutus]|uniref:Uncharacterized protein n=1 Tax=Rubus argutus TaxID=59490 RepID=A0AAW1WX69_RUBAR